MVTGKLYNSGNKKICTYIFLLFFRFFLLFIVSNFFVQKLSASVESIAVGSLGKITKVVAGSKQILANDYFKVGMRSVSTIITVYGVFSFLASNIKYLKTNPKVFSKNLIKYLTDYAYKLVGLKLIMVILRTVINHMKNKKMISAEEGDKLLKNVDKVESFARGSNLFSLKNVVETMKFFADVQKEYFESQDDNKKNKNNAEIKGNDSDVKEKMIVQDSRIAVIEKWVDRIVAKPEIKKDQNKKEAKSAGVRVEALYDVLMSDKGPVEEGLSLLYNVAQKAGKDDPVIDGAVKLGENVLKVLDAKKVGKNFVLDCLKKADIFKLKDTWDKINPKKKLDDALYKIMDNVEAIIVKSLTGADVIKFKEEMKHVSELNNLQIEQNNDDLKEIGKSIENEIKIK